MPRHVYQAGSFVTASLAVSARNGQASPSSSSPNATTIAMSNSRLRREPSGVRSTWTVAGAASVVRMPVILPGRPVRSGARPRPSIRAAPLRARSMARRWLAGAARAAGSDAFEFRPGAGGAR